jgi:hypothetical protein
MFALLAPTFAVAQVGRPIETPRVSPSISMPPPITVAPTPIITPSVSGGGPGPEIEQEHTPHVHGCTKFKVRCDIYGRNCFRTDECDD